MASQVHCHEDASGLGFIADDDEFGGVPAGV
jgi:hypothetical protein